MKLIELEVSYEGYARRSTLQADLKELLSRNWDDDTTVIKSITGKKMAQAKQDIDEQAWQKRYDDLGKVYGDAA